MKVIASIVPTAIAVVGTVLLTPLVGPVAAAMIASGLATVSAAVLQPKGSTRQQGAELRMKLDPNMPRQVAVGRTATGGSLVWSFTNTDDGEKPNRYLWRVIQLSDFPIHGVVAVREGNQVLTFSGDIHTGLRACNQHLSKKGNTRMWLRVFKGSFTPTAATELVSASGGIWTSSHKGVGLAYAIVRYDYDADAFPNGEPQLTFEVDGAPLYDDRKDGSKPGRSGAHRLNNVATWEFSTNAALITAQILRGFYINTHLIIGVGAQERDLSDTMLLSAYNTCDQPVANASGGTQARYMAGRMLNSEERGTDILDDMQLAMDGRVYDRGGSITILPGATHTPVFDLTDEDIVWTEEKSWQPRASVENVFNYLSGSFIDPVNGYTEKPYPPLRNDDWEADDGGERFEHTANFNAVFDWSQVQRTTMRMHAASRFQGIVAFTGPMYLFEMEQGDWFRLTSERWDFVQKYFVAEYVHIIPGTLRVIVIGRETNPIIDGWNPAVDEKPRTDASWNPPDYDPIVPTITLDPYLDVGDNGFALPALLIVVGGVPDDGVTQYVELQLAYADDLNTSWAGPILSVEKLTTIISSLASGTEYAVRGRSFDGKQFSAWSAWVTEFTPSVDGAQGPPGKALLINVDRTVFTFNANGEPNPFNQLATLTPQASGLGGAPSWSATRHWRNGSTSPDGFSGASGTTRFVSAERFANNQVSHIVVTLTQEALTTEVTLTAVSDGQPNLTEIYEDFNYPDDSPSVVANEKWLPVDQGSAEVSVGTDASGYPSGKALSVGNNSGNDLFWRNYVDNLVVEDGALYECVFDIQAAAGTPGFFWAGVTGLAANGNTLVNVNGDNYNANQHYFAAAAQTTPVSRTLVRGYFRGRGTPAGTPHNSPIDPGLLHPKVVRVAPMMVLNGGGSGATGAAGTTAVRYVGLRKVDTEGMGLVCRGGIVPTSNNSIKRVHSSAWDAEAYTLTSYPRTARISARMPADLNGSIMIGLNTAFPGNDNASPEYTTLEAAWYWDGTGKYWQVYESGSGLTNYGGNWSDFAEVVMNGAERIYYLNGVEKYRSTLDTTGLRIYGNLMIHGQNQEIVDIHYSSAGLKGDKGDNGSPGDAVDIIFRRSASQPATPSPSAGVPSGWYSDVNSVPGGSDPIWASTGTKAGGVTNYTWQTPVRQEGMDGLSVAELIIYRRSATAPATPTGGSFNFTTQTLTPPSGWTSAIPAGTDPVYTSRSVASIRGTTGTATPGTWSAPQISMRNGDKGDKGDKGDTGNPGRSAIPTSSETAPSSPIVGDMWYKPSTKKLYRWNGSLWEQIMGNVASFDLVTATIMSVGQLAAITVYTGDLQIRAVSGQDGSLRIWDETNTKRVQLGNLTI